MKWFNIIKAGKDTHSAARSVRIVLIEAGFPSRYIKKLKVNKWGQGEHSILYQINPEYLIEAGEDFNAWLDDRDKETRTAKPYSIVGAGPVGRKAEVNIEEEAIPYIEQLIDHAINKWTKDGKP